ncbi:HoxN/HupN/NixA family nickel/cobalt transporter [Chromobacterium sp. ATCC 53434]|uniref:HoxN/HupN/NixA family nickel/cobalt transporter n=1 Tax=Chromobacterium sp. (strain ATCC 53434 / SC 14030) TaxID=2059672 RepID=UPI000C781BD5|nr:HoxN/HupN/NixA family nickel/cobalt transporter [Chromobacterium sp. ATCC 53434]AUH51972.1 HoxN/HupN/NixA family nickel/cobalt transporter [Chromobacterium sp. ATCC 53434]
MHPSTAPSAGRRLARHAPILSGLILANLLAWAWAFAAFADHPAQLATALLAYLFGLRHAVDADHIAAIDNTVRKLMQEGRRPSAVGLFFSLGHSAVVVIAVAVIVFAASALQSRVTGFKETGSVIGTSVSAFFLLTLALINLSSLRAVWGAFRRARAGEAICDEQLDLLLNKRGLIARLLKPLFKIVGKSWHMLPIGFLFGLGFDTATEIGLFAIATSQSAHGVALWHIMVFPVLFAAGMALVDTLDSMMMVEVYGWAFVNPVRKLWYNLTITFVSVVVAVGIGGLEGLGLLADKLQLTGAFWDWIAALNDDLAHFGYFVVAVFLFTWLASAGIYKWKRFDQLTPEAR